MAEEKFKFDKFIDTIAEKEDFKNFTIKSTPISSYGVNSGRFFLVDIAENEKKSLNLFVKTVRSPKVTRPMIPANKDNHTETIVYTTVAETFLKLQERHQVPEQKRFKFPKYYGSIVTELEELVVLENIAAEGYITYDKLKPITWEYAMAALEEVSKFHALSFALKEENPEEFAKLIDRVSIDNGPKITKPFMGSAKKLLPILVDSIEPENRGRFEKYFDDKDISLVNQFKGASKYSVLIHGDYRVGNILVQYANNKLASLIPVDYQTVLYGSPLHDLICLLFTGSDETFRRQHYEQYFEHYYNCLTDFLKLLSHDINAIYPKTAFYFELKETLCYGLETAFNLVLTDPKNEGDADKITDLETRNITADNVKPNDVYIERLKGIVRDYDRWVFFEDKDNPTWKIQLNSSKETTSVDIENNTTRTIEKYISKIAKNEGFKNYTLKTTPISTEGANYTGDLFYVDVTEDGRDTLKLFLKVANASEQIRQIMPIGELYTQEAFIYTTLADAYDALQQRHGVPEEKRFQFPKYYGANLKEFEELIVFENLAANGYILYDRFHAVDWDYAKAAIEEIAKFHALSFAMKKEDCYTSNEIYYKFPNVTGKQVILQIFSDIAQAGIPYALRAVEPEYRELVENYIHRNRDKLLVEYIKPTSKYCAIIHADYRASNIMVKYQENQVVSLKPVDYQSAQYGSPIIDILYFLFTGSDENFRGQYFEQCLEHYHNSLGEFLGLLSQDVNHIYPKSAFYSDLQDKMLFGLEVGLLILHIVLTEVDNSLKIEDIVNAEKASFIPKPNKMYVDRLNGVIRDFVRWGFLKAENKEEEKIIV